ncbi:glycosyltransferase family 2 protein [Poriferisphaera sp. WC338]|uniref:glycosyltransferase family 2 protein n=1 Tax=Poriferisphaera sp. WC338 TaxID=3425129 RepID=UPI003D81AEB6
MLALNTIQIILVVIGSVMLLQLALECWCAVIHDWFIGDGSKKAAEEDGQDREPATFVIPAHNEASIIRDMLTEFKKQVRENDHVIVVAHNCSDETAEVAREFNVHVCEYDAPDEIGKAFALAGGVDYARDHHLESSCIVVMDADCYGEPHAMDRLVRYIQKSGRVVQSIYMMRQGEDDNSVISQVSTLALYIKNHVRLLGLNVLGMPVQITGSGFGMPYSMAMQINFRSTALAEDMRLGMELACVGQGAVLCENARVSALLPENNEIAEKQRTRWEHGHLEILFGCAPRLIKSAIVHAHPRLLLSALDLAVPPLAVTTVLTIALLFVVGAIGALTGEVVPFIILFISACLAGGGIMLGWIQFARKDVPLSVIWKIPRYVVWKVPIYFKFFGKRQSGWVKTKRDEEEHKQ